jgi:uncharacterized protein (TIGR02996 family)
VSDFAALRRAVLAAPDEDDPRLALADWYGENGDEARAEFVRVQVELARAYPDLGSPCESRWCIHPGCALLRRMFGLSASHADSWVPPALVGRVMWVWRRGFVGEIRGIDAADFLKHADALVWPPTVACGRCVGGLSLACKPYNPAMGPPGVPGTGDPVRMRLPKCDGTGRVPNPDPPPPTAMPVRKVTLTTEPQLEIVCDLNDEEGGCRLPGRQMIHRTPTINWNTDIQRILTAEWPGVEFVLPPADLFTPALGRVNAEPFGGFPAGRLRLQDLNIDRPGDARWRARLGFGHPASVPPGFTTVNAHGEHDFGAFFAELAAAGWHEETPADAD